MSFKNNECPNCGANLSFNSRTHTYECNYCGSKFKDTKAGTNGDARVELTPEDLELLKPVSKKSMGKQDGDNILKIIVIVMAVMFIAPTFFSIITMLLMLLI